MFEFILNIELKIYLRSLIVTQQQNFERNPRSFFSTDKRSLIFK